MTTGGWIFLAVSWLCILGVFAYSMVRTLRGKDDSGEPPAATPGD